MSAQVRETGRSTRRDATRERVLDAAREVFAERGVFGGTVEEICERAGYTRGAFYSNFADKDDVLEALVDRERTRLLDELDAHLSIVDDTAGSLWAMGMDADADPAGILETMVDRILASIPADRLFSLVQTELEIYAIRQPTASRSFLDAQARFRARIAGFIERGMARLGRELTVDAGEVAEAAVAVVERSVRRSLLFTADDSYAGARVILPGLFLAVSRPLSAS